MLLLLIFLEDGILLSIWAIFALSPFNEKRMKEHTGFLRLKWQAFKGLIKSKVKCVGLAQDAQIWDLKSEIFLYATTEL